MMNKTSFVTSVTMQLMQFQRISCYMSYMWQNNEKMFTLKFDMDKYSSLESMIIEMLKSNRMNCYICRSCHSELQPKCTCVCCNTDVQKDISKMYNKVDYDFSCFVVLRCLRHVSNPANNEDQYICASCDKRVKETSNENTVLPYYGKYPHAVAEANFLKALNQRPEYVCTCCHCMLFCKTVWRFHTTDYDMSNETVKECTGKLHRYTSHENDEMGTHKWPQIVQGDVEHNDIYVMNEFICKCCRNSLWKKPQKCLTRHEQMVCSYMTPYRIYKTYCHWREELFLHEFHS